MNDQLKAWDMYHRASLEARVMNKLYHKHVLGLIGLCYWPQLSILIEFAPKGDLKTVLEDYKSEGIRLSRRTIKTTLIQVSYDTLVKPFHTIDSSIFNSCIINSLYLC